MNLRRRITIIRIAVRFIRIRSQTFQFAARLLVRVADSYLPLARWTTHRRFKALKKAGDRLTLRNNSFRAACQGFSTDASGHREIRRQRLLATQSALVAEGARLQAAVVEIQSPQTLVGAALLIYIAESTKARILKIQRSNEALKRIISQIRTSPNFYWDLLLWFALPGGCVEDQLGDLNEEFVLRNSNDGEVLANAWYRHQVISSIRDRLWNKIERLVTIGTLIDFASRWFRH
jgi:hypothetical protein